MWGNIQEICDQFSHGIPHPCGGLLFPYTLRVERVKMILPALSMACDDEVMIGAGFLDRLYPEPD
jgi:hypothetical protein